MWRRRHDVRRFTFRRTRRRPIGERPGFLVAVETAETTDLGQELAQAVAEVHQAGARGAIDQTIDQLHQHHGAKHELRPLPHQQEHHHPQHSKQDGLVFGFYFWITHFSLRSCEVGVQLKPLAEIKSTSVFGSPRINSSITCSSLRPSNRIPCNPATNGMYTPTSWDLALSTLSVFTPSATSPRRLTASSRLKPWPRANPT